MATVETQRPWLMLAILSGACAAFNGVFAKLYFNLPHIKLSSVQANTSHRTTTSLTASWAHAIASLLHVPPTNKFTEYAIRAMFFALNMTFNGVMYDLLMAFGKSYMF